MVSELVLRFLFNWAYDDNKWSIEMPEIAHKQNDNLELELLNVSTTYTSEYFKGEKNDLIRFFSAFNGFVFADFSPYHLKNIKIK